MRAIVVLTVLVLILHGQDTHAQSTDPLQQFERGKQAYQQQDYRGALETFRAARDAGLSGPAVHYNIGVAAYRLGLYEEAETAFVEVARTPAMAGLAHYNLGVVRLARDDPQAARRWFEQTLAEAADEKLRRLAALQLERLTPRSQPPRWVGFAGVNAGYDDNVALVADEAVLEISELGDSFLGAQLGFSGPLDWRFRFDGALFYVDYTDLDEFDQMALRAGGTYWMPIGDWAAEMGLHGGYSALDGEGFEDSGVVTLQGSRRLSGPWRLRLRYRFEDINGRADFESLTGTRHEASLRLDRRSQRLQTRLEYRFELNDREDDDVSPTRHGVTLGFEWTLQSPLILGLEAGYRDSRYDIAAAADRDEQRLAVGLYLTRRFGEWWEATMRYDFADNASDVEDFDYQRQRVMLGVNALF